MTKIKSYPIDNDITGSDKWIGTDGGGFNRTKNFTVTGLANHFNETRKIELSNSLSFKYDTVDVGDDRSIGSFSFENEIGSTVPFSSISNLIFHKNTSNGKTVTNFMGGLTDAIVLIHRSDNPDIYGLFKFKSYQERIDDTDFYDVVLEYIQGNGSIEEDKFYFFSLVQLDPELDKSYIHNQVAASSSWEITHNLGKYPSVSIVDSGGNWVVGDIVYTNKNTLIINFTASFSGKAYLN